MTKKLSPAQLAVLERMAGGGRIWTTGERFDHAYWVPGTRDKAPSFLTLARLEREGMVKKSNLSGTGKEYTITPAGLAMLEDQR